MTTKPLVIDVEDTFRKKNGWKGEMDLFRLANEQHKSTHDKHIVGCDICEAIMRSFARLIDEGREKLPDV